MTIDGVVIRLFDLLLAPFVTWPVALTLTVVSFATALLVLVVVGATSNGSRVAAAKRQIRADLLEMRLFNADLAAMLRAQRDILRHNAAYLRLLAVPMLCTAVPIAIIVAQLQCRFGLSGVTPGQPVLVSVGVSSVTTGIPDIAMDGDGLRADSPVVWLPAVREAARRMVAGATGDYIIHVRMGDQTYTKTLHASNDLRVCSTVRPSARLLDRMLHPCENAVARQGTYLVNSRDVSPLREIDLLGWRVRWLPMYVVESMVFVLALRSPLRVEI